MIFRTIYGVNLYMRSLEARKYTIIFDVSGQSRSWYFSTNAVRGARAQPEPYTKFFENLIYEINRNKIFSRYDF